MPGRVIEITPKLVDWLLYNLHTLRQQIEEADASTSSSVVTLPRGNSLDSRVERVAVKLATITAVLDAAERGIRALHPEQRKVYRMKYRAGMSYRQMERRLFLSGRTIHRRVEEVREVVGRYLSSVPEHDLREFFLAVSKN